MITNELLLNVLAVSAEICPFWADACWRNYISNKLNLSICCIHSGDPPFFGWLPAECIKIEFLICVYAASAVEINSFW